MVFLVYHVGGDHVSNGNYCTDERFDSHMRKSGFHVLRVGIAVTFLWIGILIFKNPEAWGTGFIQPWAAGLLPIPIREAMISTAILDIVIGVALLIDTLTWLAGAVGSIHLIIVLIVSGINEITVRDIGLLSATLALFAHSIPARFIPRKVRPASSSPPDS